jgi:hypothetical protein
MHLDLPRQIGDEAGAFAIAGDTRVIGDGGLGSSVGRRERRTERCEQRANGDGQGRCGGGQYTLNLHRPPNDLTRPALGRRLSAAKPKNRCDGSKLARSRPNLNHAPVKRLLWRLCGPPHRNTCQISRHTRNKGQARFRARALGRQTAIRAKLFRASGPSNSQDAEERSGGQVTDGRQTNFLKPRLNRGGEDCDARSHQSAKPRKSPGFANGVDRLVASDGPARKPVTRTAHGWSQRIMVYCSTARADLGRDPQQTDPAL